MQESDSNNTNALSIVSFNLRYGLALDAENAWPKRKELLVETIRRLAPDVLATQECFDFQAEYLAQSMPEYAWLGVGREVGGEGEMAAIFYRRNALDMKDSGHFWLSDTPEIHGSRAWNASCTRMATWARFRHLAANTTLQVFNTHFDHRSEEARDNSAKLFIERARKLPPALPVIIVGDFNAPAERCTAWRAFIEAGFADAWQAAAEHVGPDNTYHGFGTTPEDLHERIDWLLVRNTGPVTRCETVTYSRDGRYPSDHYPVAATIMIRQ